MKDTGTAGMLVFKFNNRGTYDYAVIIPNSDPGMTSNLCQGSIKILRKYFRAPSASIIYKVHQN
jgi:hypothetical protein